jgi:hypothetical protein
MVGLPGMCHHTRRGTAKVTGPGERVRIEARGRDGVGEMNILLIALAFLTAAFLTIISLIIIALSIGYRDDMEWKGSLNEEEHEA